jgi:CheY-like chemotaxis protein
VHNDRLVLVVSDDPEERERTVSAVLGLGYAVLCAETGRHALEVLAENPSIGVVVADVAAKGGPNAGLARRLRQLRAEVAVLDAYAFREWVERSLVEPEDEFASDRPVADPARYSRLLV